MEKKVEYSIDDLLDYYASPIKKKGERLGVVKAKILSGESTGDRINDFLILASHNEEVTKTLETYFRNLQKQVQENQGFPVLYVAYQRHSWAKGEGCFGGGGHAKIEIETAKFGILRGEMDFNFKKRSLILPAGKHLYKDARFNEDVPFVRAETPLAIPIYEPFGAALGWSQHQPSFIQDPLKMCGGSIKTAMCLKREFFFKDTAEYLLTKHSLCNALYFHDEKEVTDWVKLGKQNAGNYKYYASLFGLLGEQVPENAQAKAIEQIKKEKEVVLAELQHLIPKRERQNEPRLKELLRTAIELGLHEEKKKVKLGPGITLNLADSIRELSKEYNIPIQE